MSDNLSAAEKREALASIQRFISDELELDISELQAGFLMDYFFKELAPFAYNQGIEDAKNFFLLQSEDLSANCFANALTFWKKRKRR